MEETMMEAAAEMLPMAVIVVIDFTAVIAAVVIDLVSGLMKAGREGAKKTSKGLRRTVTKLTGYMMMMFSTSVLDGVLTTAVVYLRVAHGVDMPVLPAFTTLGALALCLIEGKSVVENTSRDEDERRRRLATLRRLLGDERLRRLLGDGGQKG